ncbi:MAG: bestrophin family protein [Polyangiales bacterium]
MIEYDGRNWLRIVFRLDGSVLPRLLPRVLASGAIGGLAAWLFIERGVKFPPLAHTLIGVALGLLLVFRTNASYDRYWEGRRLLGFLVNRTRDLARQIVAYVDDAKEREELRRMVSAFYALSAMTLRRERDLGTLGDRLTREERAALEPRTHRAPILAAMITARLAKVVQNPTHLLAMEQNLTSLNDSLGGAERIMRTPIPFAYAQHIKTFVALFCFTAPFVMAESMRWYTPVAAAVLAFALFGIDEIGVEIEDPFGHDANDLPLDAIGAGIEAATTEIVETVTR